MEEIGYYLKKIHNHLETNFTRTFKKYGLTCTQMDVLEYLSQETGELITLSDLASHFDVRHTSMIHVLKRLEDKEFICRKNIARDTRTKPIELTDKGMHIISVGKNMRTSLNQILISGITAEEQQLLIKMLDQIYKNLNSDAFKELSNINNYEKQEQ